MLTEGKWSLHWQNWHNTQNCVLWLLGAGNVEMICRLQQVFWSIFVLAMRNQHCIQLNVIV